MEQFANAAVTTLASSIDNSQTSITVAAFTGFPSSAQYRIRIESEILIVTGGAGTTTWTVTRGAESTTAASHTGGVSVVHVLTAGGLSQFRSDSTTRGAVASLPSAGTAGRLYLTTDDQYIYEDNGSAWAAFAPVFPVTTPPAFSGYTWDNQGTATLTQSTNGSALFDNTSQAGNSVSGLYTSAPATPWSITALIQAAWYPQNYLLFSLFFRESSSGKIHTFGPYAAPTQGDVNIQATKWTTSTSQLANYTTFANIGPPINQLWMKIQDDGTNRNSYLSADGVSWILWHQIGRTDFLTANQYGFCLGNGSGGTSGHITARILSWSVGT